MSEYVVHFTKDSDEQSAYQNMMSILGVGELRPGGSFGAGRGLGALGDSQRCVCLSEVPLGSLKRLVDRRSRYGIAFTQEFLSDRGGARVWYVDKDTAAHEAFEALKKQKLDKFDASDPFWRVTPFVDFPGDYGGTSYRFEWEREWRIQGSLAFVPDDVSFLFIPEDQHDAARAFFAEAKAENTGPSYICPFLDPLWDLDRVESEIEDHAKAMEVETSAGCPYRELFAGSLCPACGQIHP